MELTNAQQAAINHIDGHLQIIACAGSGKTEVISRRIANILQRKPDVKPENIMLTEKGIVKLTDLGLAMQQREWAEDMEISGSPSYMSRNNLQGKSWIPEVIFTVWVLHYIKCSPGSYHSRGKLQPVLQNSILKMKPNLLRNSCHPFHPMYQNWWQK